MRFKVAVKQDPAGMLKGSYQAEVSPQGLTLEQKKQTPIVVPRGTPARHDGGNRVSVHLPDRPVTFAVSKFPAYQTRLAQAVAGYLSGQRDVPNESEFKMEWWLLVPAVLPFGIMILTRGGAIWGALGGALAMGCLAIAQIESIPRIGRLALIVAINVAIYALIALLVVGASSAVRADGSM